MADMLIKNARVVTCSSVGPKMGSEMNDANVIENGYVLVEGDRIVEVGKWDGCSKSAHEVIDANGRVVMPGLVDPHTHLVHGGSRENELELKLKGASYLEILNNGGGILSTVKATRGATKVELSKKAKKSLDIMLKNGTTTIEAKSGYGLSLEHEVKCLEVMKEMEHPVDIITTFMGAHAVPPEYKQNREEYINLIINEMTPYVAKNNLAEFIDCFCEHGVFSVEESRKILEAGREHGLKIKMHADEIEDMGGASLAAELKAISAEHLIAASDEGIKKMKEEGVIPVLLPGTAFYLRVGRYARGRKMVDSGMAIALATDYNPGSCPTESLQNIMVFASMGMGLYPHEIINAMTINAAHAINRGNEIGSIEVGKKADLVIMDAPNEHYIVYHFGINHVDTVIKGGKVEVRDGELCS